MKNLKHILMVEDESPDIELILSAFSEHKF
jgi:hypothetical protein